jgi:UDP-N-acetyl-2-amino-2-deoxyglucuronate dehydrogenase
MKNFVLIGAGGYIAPRHMKAIKETGNNLLAALDKHDSVGILDTYFPNCAFFTEFERFDRHVEKLKRESTKIDYVSVCSPNYLHDAHIRFGLRIGADVICEKPIVLNPWNVDALLDIEAETGKRVYSILQLRLHPAIKSLQQKIKDIASGKKHKVTLKYITSRGYWYHSSWKGDIAKSGGIATNIGVHFFDMLIWIFGPVEKSVITQHSSQTAAGTLSLQNAQVDWELSINYERLPDEVKKAGSQTFRLLKIDGDTFEFSDGFTDLHTESYKQIINGTGYGLLDTKPSIDLVHKIRQYKA